LAELDARPGACRDWIEAYGQVVKLDHYSRTAILELAGEPCFAKLYQPHSWLQGRIMRTGLGRPLRSQEAARQLLRAAIRVPEPRGCIWVGDGVLTLSEGLPDSQDLQLRWGTATEPAARRQLMSTAAESLAQLHLRAYSHGDCKWSNLVCRGEQLYLVDLDAVRRSRPGSRRQARDLARFTLNAEELAVDSGVYAVFLEAYFSALEIPREGIIAQMLPELHKLRHRHRGRYGERGHALW
jgi:hypothetical protein